MPAYFDTSSLEYNCRVSSAVLLFMIRLLAMSNRVYSLPRCTQPWARNYSSAVAYVSNSLWREAAMSMSGQI
eukprot:scaffold3070_cov128-Cylindrotheca_fusiformis.AAC.4